MKSGNFLGAGALLGISLVCVCNDPSFIGWGVGAELRTTEYLIANVKFLHHWISCSKCRVLKIYKNSLSANLLLVSFNCQICSSSKSFSHFWNTRALVAAAQCSPIVNDLSIAPFLKYINLAWTMASKFVTFLMRILRTFRAKLPVYRACLLKF